MKRTCSFSMLTTEQAYAVRPRPGADRLYAMYSSIWDGIVTDPRAMVVPADDHGVHRGDGVFETLVCRDGAVFALRPHLARLASSAEGIRLPLPWDADELARGVIEVIRAGGRRECLVRILATRGPGGFGISPRECPSPALYIAAYAAPPPFMRAHPDGARAVTVREPIKAGRLATLKTCNYLPNVLMRMEAEAAGADFPLALDERGCVAEGATENFGVVDAEGRLAIPKPGRMLEGITMQRALTLAAALVHKGLLTGAGARDIPRDELTAAREVLVFGTTPEITAVVALDGVAVGGGRPGPVQQALARLFEEDVRTNVTLRTPVF